MADVVSLTRGRTPSNLPVTATTPAERQGWGAMLREIGTDLRGSRELLQQFILRDLRIKYKQAVMGFGWAIFTPLLIVAAGLLIRYAIAQASGQPTAPDVFGGIAIKALPWAFFSGAMALAPQALLNNQALLTKIYFPREVMPLATVLAQGVDTLVGALVVIVVLLVAGISVTWAALWAVPLIALLFVFTIAAALFVSCANLFFRDVKYITQVMLTFGIFATPVFFEPLMFGEVGARLLMLNPLSPLIEGLNLAVVQGHNLFEPLWATAGSGAQVLVWTPYDLLYSTAWALIGLPLSLRFFRSMTYLFAEYA